MSDEAYSHGHHASVTAVHATRTVASSAAYLEPFLEPGMDVMDLGCGPGSITAGFADLVAPGSVVGIDSSAEVVAQALAAHTDVANVEFREGNVYDLDVPDESFDVVHAHQLLQHLADPVAALREMRRLMRPGGVVAVREADFGAMTWYPAVGELDEWRELYGRLARGNRGEPDAGSPAGRRSRLRRHRGFLVELGVCRAGGPPLPRGVVGRPRAPFGVRGADARARFRRPAVPRPPGRGLAPVGTHGGRRVPDAERGDPRAGLKT